MGEYEKLTWGEKLAADYNSVTIKLVSGDEINANIYKVGLDYCEIMVNWKGDNEHFELIHKDKILTIIPER